MELSKNEQASLINILDNPEIECIGVVDPKILRKNIESFQWVLSQYRFRSTIHYVMKVNQSTILLKEAKQSWCRVDVSSYGELMGALEAWYRHDAITANGPKNKRFLEKCIDIGCNIAVDSISELESITAISKKYPKRTPVLIRLGGFQVARSTRFGVIREYWEKSIKILSESREYIEVLGYSFHIDTRWLQVRQSIFWESLEYYRLLIKWGWRPRIIDIWWWYGARYQDDTHISGKGCSRYHLGSRLYPQDDTPVWFVFLREFLESSYDTRGSIGKFLEENVVELSIEPGRSLLSQVWYIATSIIATRSDGDSESLIIDTSSFALGMREEELPTNPILLWGQSWKSHAYSLLGNLCLESDIIYCRRVELSRNAKIWDILVFPDIAAYHMDFYETRSLQHPNKFRYYRKNDTLFLDL